VAEGRTFVVETLLGSGVHLNC